MVALETTGFCQDKKGTNSFPGFPVLPTSPCRISPLDQKGVDNISPIVMTTHNFIVSKVTITKEKC